MTPTVTDDFINSGQFYVDPCETIKVKRYKSSKTGLTIVAADIEGKINVNSFFSALTNFVRSTRERFLGCSY